MLMINNWIIFYIKKSPNQFDILIWNNDIYIIWIIFLAYLQITPRFKVCPLFVLYSNNGISNVHEQKLFSSVFKPWQNYFESFIFLIKGTIDHQERDNSMGLGF